jgi:microcystin-dependent protein
MSEPFVGQIIMFGGNYAIGGWAKCDGQLLAVSQNQALFSLLGTIYGGDGRTTFALPDLRGRIPIHMGQGPGLSNRQIGSRSGQQTVQLSPTQFPNHTHGLVGKNSAADSKDPSGRQQAVTADNAYDNGTAVEMNGQAVSNAGTGSWGAHNNMQPYQCVTFLIALVGLYPSRT